MHPKRVRRFLLMGIGGLVLLFLSTVLIVYKAFSPSQACDSPTSPPWVSGKTSARTLISGGLKRCYLIYLPPQPTAQRPVPIVFSLHGLASNPEVQASTTGWEAVASQENFVVIYPQGTSLPLRWNAAPVFNINQVDDVQFFRDIVADLMNLMLVDSARIYVTGLSNGGAMTNRIACEAADLVAGIGTVDATFVDIPNGCTPLRPISVIAFHGTADPVVNYDGGISEASILTWLMNLSSESTAYPPVKTWVLGWAKRNECNLTPETIPPTGDASGIRYVGCKDAVEIIFYTIDGGGHAWPGGEPTGFGKTSVDINASETMWKFFKVHRRK